jgi:hypothetical protein
MKTYTEKLKDPRWQKKRLEIMQADGFRCRKCRDDKSTLNVHHLIYEKGKSPWDYPRAMLVTLCETCHAKAGDKVNRILAAHLFIKKWEPRTLRMILAALLQVPDEIMRESVRDMLAKWDTNDVPHADWAAEVLLAARDAAIVNGYTYDPDPASGENVWMGLEYDKDGNPIPGGTL